MQCKTVLSLTIIIKKMQKQLKILDSELKNNNLVRIRDTTNKSQNSLFRALAMALYYSHQHADNVKLDLRLALATHAHHSHAKIYPPLQQTNFLKKYRTESALMLDYWQQQDLQCFLNDNLILASSMYGVTICMLSVDREGYLIENYFMGSKDGGSKKINLTKVGKKYFCVLEVEQLSQIRMVSQIIEDIIALAFEEDQAFLQEQEKEPEEAEPQLTVSLSISHQFLVDISSKKDVLEPEEPNISEQKQQHAEIKQIVYESAEIKQIEEQNQKIESNTENYTPIQGYDPAVLEPYNYYGYSYQQYMVPQQHYISEQGYLPEHNYNYGQPINPVNNTRYTGRLKFFDQSGNYGFLVVDNLNIDLFVHFDDLSKAGLSKEKLLGIKNSYQLRFEFTYYQYEGKHRKSKKAVDLKMLSE